MILNSKTAIVTGASRGLGAATAEALVLKNVTVYGLARSANDLKVIQSNLGESFIPIPVDITNKPEVDRWFQTTFSNRHRPDILINNAGSGNFGKIDELPFEMWQQMMDTNLNGMYYITSATVPYMKQNPETCHIINIGSILGTTGRTESSAYCATKFGLRGFSESLSYELRYEGIKVSAIHPGSIETRFFSESGIESHSNMLQPKEIADLLIHTLETPDNMLIGEITLRPLNPKNLT